MGLSCEVKNCPHGCGKHGQCYNGTCICHHGWAGNLCAQSRCPNGCNGHGTCGQGNVCTCETGYTFAPDCSMSECPGLVVMIRVCLRSLALLVCWTILLVSTVNCPTGNAWADKASAANTAHSSQECSNQGTCTRSDGKCQCYPGFTGRACQRCKNGFLIPLLRR